MSKPVTGSENVNVASATGRLRGSGTMAGISRLGATVSLLQLSTLPALRGLAERSTMPVPVPGSVRT